MKKVLLSVAILLCLSGCNRQILDVTYKYNYAYVYLPTGEVIEGPVDSWSDYQDGDQLQVKINGVTYLSHSTNIVLVAK